MPTEQSVARRTATGRLVSYRARRPVATLLLSHGAGRGIDTRDLEALAATLPRQGINVQLFEQPWRVAGRKVASPPATLDAGFVAAASALRTRTPLVVGGRSAGARSAARTAEPSARPAASRWPSRCTRPAGPRSHGSTSCWAPG